MRIYFVLVFTTMSTLAFAGEPGEQDLQIADKAYRAGLRYLQDDQWVMAKDRAEYCEQYATRALAENPAMKSRKPAGLAMTGDEIARACKELLSAAYALRDKGDAKHAADEAAKNAARIADDVEALARAEEQLARGRQILRAAKPHAAFDARYFLGAAEDNAKGIAERMREYFPSDQALDHGEVATRKGTIKARAFLDHVVKVRDEARAAKAPIEATAYKQGEALRASLVKKLSGDRARIMKQHGYPTWMSFAPAGREGAPPSEGIVHEARRSTQWRYTKGSCTMLFDFKGDKLSKTQRSPGCS